MDLCKLPKEIIQLIIDFLPRDDWKKLVELDNWVGSYTFRKFYEKITLVNDPYAYSLSTCYTGMRTPKAEPFFGNKVNSGCVFGSMYAFSQFIEDYPEFIPAEITFHSLQLLISLLMTNLTFLQKVEKIRFNQVYEQSPQLASTLAQLFAMIQKYDLNYYSEVFDSEVDRWLDNIKFPTRIRNIEVPEGTIIDFEKFFRQHPNLDSLVTRNLYQCDKDVFPESLTYVGYVLFPGVNTTVELPQTIKHVKLKCLEDAPTFSKDLDLAASEGLESLAITGCWIDEPIRLPENLKSFRYDECLCNCHFNDLFVGPEHITRLDIHGSFGLTLYYSLFYEATFPETLQEFYFENTNIIQVMTPDMWGDIDMSACVLEHPFIKDDKVFKIDHHFKLPKSLKVLYLHSPFTTIDSTWRIPDNVSRLSLLSIQYMMDFANFHMPKGLKYFFLEAIHGFTYNDESTNYVYFPQGIETFVYSGSPIKSPDSNLLELPSLKKIVFGSNLVSPNIKDRVTFDGIPLGETDFSKMTNLETFEMNIQPILGELNMKFPNNLHILKFALCKIDSISPTFQFPSNLRELSFECVNFDLEMLNRLPQTLEIIDFTNCRCAESDLLDLNLPYLIRLNMNNCELSQSTFEKLKLKKFSRLKEVCLSNNKFDRIDLSAFPETLTNLSLFRCTEVVTASSETNLPNLRFLDISSNQVGIIKDSSELEPRFHIPRKLHTLSMKNCGISNAEFAIWPKKLGKLCLELNKIDPQAVHSLCMKYHSVAQFEGIHVTDFFPGSKYGIYANFIASRVLFVQEFGDVAEPVPRRPT
ncbi:uncharacterized protein J8A68_003253 [[Candida] subhashii]|uniref:Uncharacterized protein n=1 Tax=[Candida] subhashii TaxID=561895 RepID=A0A8J5QJG3_9ASCO|nr:uncharacterized protein J8A68_003253 [[Candida] subhashii]KAG7663253.1 hypothetical protein J8A68_003253 [[Candida] subhashii]